MTSPKRCENCKWHQRARGVHVPFCTNGQKEVRMPFPESPKGYVVLCNTPRRTTDERALGGDCGPLGARFEYRVSA